MTDKTKEASARSALKLALEGAANYIDALGGDSRKYRQALADIGNPITEQLAIPTAITCPFCSSEHVPGWLHDYNMDRGVYGEQPAIKQDLTPEQHQCNFPLCQSEDYQQALAEQIKRELYTGEPAQQQDFSDAYQGAMEDLAIWKKRALEAEELNRKFIADINGQTFMGEPTQKTCLAANEPCKHGSWCSEVYCQEHCKFVAQPAQQHEQVAFLANGTRFKMSFFDSEVDGCGNTGTYVTCFEAFEKELDGRWVALVAAEDDCHLKLTSPPASQPWVGLTDEEAIFLIENELLGRGDLIEAIEAKLKDKNGY